MEEVMAKTVEVALIPVTEAQSNMLDAAARTLWWLYELHGNPVHKEQYEVVRYFSGSERGLSAFRGYGMTYEVPVAEEAETAV